MSNIMIETAGAICTNNTKQRVTIPGTKAEFLRCLTAITMSTGAHKATTIEVGAYKGSVDYPFFRFAPSADTIIEYKEFKAYLPSDWGFYMDVYAGTTAELLQLWVWGAYEKYG